MPLTTLTRESGAAQPLPQPAPVTPARQPNTPRTEPITEPPPPPPTAPPQTPRRAILTSPAVPAQPPTQRVVSNANTPQTILFTRPPPVQTTSSTTRSTTTTTRYRPSSTTTPPSDVSEERERVVNVKQPLAPNGRTLLSPHTDNYCDIREYPDEVLSEKHLQRVEYFVGNLSCNRQFFECAVGQTYMMNCTSNEQVFDISTMNCNFRSSVKSCPEFDMISHCSK